MPIDPRFQKNRKKVGKEKGIAIWGPVDPPEKLGIHGTHVAIDWDMRARRLPTKARNTAP